MRPHSLVIGGTGMLRPVSVYLARQGHTVSVIARNRDRLFELIKETNREPGVINTIPLDYADTDLLTMKLEEAIAILGPITTAVSWIHSTAPEASMTIADIINRQVDICRFFDLVGSANQDPENLDNGREDLFRAYERIRYRRIILGHIVEDGGKRWLTNREISDGIISALESDTAETIIGSI